MQRASLLVGLASRHLFRHNVYSTNLARTHSTLYLFNRTSRQANQFTIQQRNVFNRSTSDNSDKNVLWYILSGLVVMIGATYAAVPLYKIFCESQGIDVSTEYRDKGLANLKEKLSSMKKDTNRKIAVKFDASTSSDLLWKFIPCQDEITVVPGETALAFFKAKNMTSRPIIGIATYTILPYDAGLYFNKIQCFCFEEQRLEPNEEVDMPVLFFLDDQFASDPKLENVDSICLSYMFFESKGSEEDIVSLQKVALAAARK